MEDFKENDAKKELEKRYQNAEELLKDVDKTERFLQNLEKKLQMIPVAGKTISMVPTLISLVRSYINKEYIDVPIGTIIAIVSALIYCFSPVDAIPDVIPGIGYVDDAAVIAFCLKMVESDVSDYQKWREKNNRIIND